MPEERNVTVDRPDVSDQAIDSRAHLGRAFSAGTSVPKDQPVWCARADLRWRESLVLAVIPLAQVGFERGERTEARQVACLACTTQRTDEDSIEVLLRQHRSEKPGGGSPVIRQCDIGGAGVLSTDTPLRLAVTNHIHALLVVAHRCISSCRSHEQILARTGRANVRE